MVKKTKKTKKTKKKRVPKTVRISVPVHLLVGGEIQGDKLKVTVPELHSDYDSCLLKGIAQEKIRFAVDLMGDLYGDKPIAQSVVWLEAVVDVPQPLEPKTVQVTAKPTPVKKAKRKKKR